jgi:hypothetical protein
MIACGDRPPYTWLCCDLAAGHDGPHEGQGWCWSYELTPDEIRAWCRIEGRRWPRYKLNCELAAD